MSKYTVDYFIEKFSRIPKNRWTVNEFRNSKGQRCALGHCGETSVRTPESLALHNLFVDFNAFDLDFRPMLVNDGDGKYCKLGKHPRTRILRALRMIKKGNKRK